MKCQFCKVIMIKIPYQPVSTIGNGYQQQFFFKCPNCGRKEK